MAFRTLAVLVLVVLTSAAPASAEDTAEKEPSNTSPRIFAMIGKALWQTAKDPTTYPAAVLFREAKTHDWETSQPLFEKGWMEANRYFTESHYPNSTPLGFEEGKRVIRKYTVRVLLASTVNNLTMRALEQHQRQIAPEHKKLWTTLSWVERIAFNTWLSYYLSVDSFRQIGINKERLRNIK